MSALQSCSEMSHSRWIPAERVHGAGFTFGIWGLGVGFGIQGSELRVWVLGFGVWGLEFGAERLGIWVQGLGIWV